MNARAKILLLIGLVCPLVPAAETLTPYEVVGTSIPRSLTGTAGDAERGKAVAAHRQQGNCLGCHQIPALADLPFHGDVGPSLAGVGRRLEEGELRLRVVDPKRVNPGSVMPAFYKADGLFRVMPTFADKSVLTAEQVEDVVAFLLTLTDPSATVTASEPRYDPEAVARVAPPAGSRLVELVSGNHLQAPAGQAMQRDDTLNPGMLWVDRGRRLWDTADGKAGKSCADCHGAASQSMRTVGVSYPKHVPASGAVMNIEQRINRCRAERMQAEPWAFLGEELTAMTVYVRHQSRGSPVSVQIDGPAATAYARGKEHFYTRRGQLDLSCAQCHELHTGRFLRGNLLTQGHTNGEPTYRLGFATLEPNHWWLGICNERVRSTRFPYLSDEYVALELFLAWRGQGLPVESPAVRW